MTPWTTVCQAPLSMRFSRLEYWSGLSSPFPRDFLDPGMELCLLCLMHWQLGFFFLPIMPPGKLKASLSQFSSVAQSCLTLCDPVNCSTPGLLSITNSRSLPKPMSIESVMPSNHLILYHPLLLLPSIFLSIRVFSNEWAICIRWPKFWSFCIRPSNEYSGLISFRIDWFDFLAVQGKGLLFLKSLLQHHSSKPSILRH